MRSVEGGDIFGVGSSSTWPRAEAYYSALQAGGLCISLQQTRFCLERTRGISITGKETFNWALGVFRTMLRLLYWMEQSHLPWTYSGSAIQVDGCVVVLSPDEAGVAGPKATMFCWSSGLGILPLSNLPIEPRARSPRLRCARNLIIAMSVTFRN